MNLQRGSHYDEHVRLASEVSGLNGANVIAQGVRFIIQNDRGSQRAYADGSGGPGDTGFCYTGNESDSGPTLIYGTYIASSTLDSLAACLL